MGCRKVEMKLIQDRKRRLATYRKRKVGLQNKARELGTLCGVPALVVCVGPDGQVDTWPTTHKEVDDIVAKYRSLCPDGRNKYKLGMADCSEKGQIVAKRLDEMSEEALKSLADSLDLKMACIEERIRMLDIVRKCIQGCGMNVNDTLGCEDWDACQKVSGDHQLEEMVFNPCIEDMLFGRGVAEDAFLTYPNRTSEMEAVSLQQIGSEQDSTICKSGLDYIPVQEHMDFSSTKHVAMDAYPTSPYGFSDAIFDGWISSRPAFSLPPASWPPLTTNAADLSFACPQFESTFGMSANSLLTATGGGEDFYTTDLGFGQNDMQYDPDEALRHWLSDPLLTCTADLGFGLNDMQCYPAEGLQHCPSDARLTGIAAGGDAYTADMGCGLNEHPFAHLLALP